MLELSLDTKSKSLPHPRTNSGQRQVRFNNFVAPGSSIDSKAKPAIKPEVDKKKVQKLFNLRQTLILEASKEDCNKCFNIQTGINTPKSTQSRYDKYGQRQVITGITNVNVREVEIVPGQIVEPTSKIDLHAQVKERLNRERNAFEIRLAKQQIDDKISAAFAHPSTKFMTSSATKLSLLEGIGMNRVKNLPMKRTDSDKAIFAFLGQSSDDVTTINNIQLRRKSIAQKLQVPNETTESMPQFQGLKKAALIVPSLSSSVKRQQSQMDMVKQKVGNLMLASWQKAAIQKRREGIKSICYARRLGEKLKALKNTIKKIQKEKQAKQIRQLARMRSIHSSKELTAYPDIKFRKQNSYSSSRNLARQIQLKKEEPITPSKQASGKKKSKASKQHSVTNEGIQTVDLPVSDSSDASVSIGSSSGRSKKDGNKLKLPFNGSFNAEPKGSSENRVLTSSNVSQSKSPADLKKDLSASSDEIMSAQEENQTSKAKQPQIAIDISAFSNLKTNKFQSKMSSPDSADVFSSEEIDSGEYPPEGIIVKKIPRKEGWGDLSYIDEENESITDGGQTSKSFGRCVNSAKRHGSMRLKIIKSSSQIAHNYNMKVDAPTHDTRTPKNRYSSGLMSHGSVHAKVSSSKSIKVDSPSQALHPFRADSPNVSVKKRKSGLIGAVNGNQFCRNLFGFTNSPAVDENKKDSLLTESTEKHQSKAKGDQARCNLKLKLRETEQSEANSYRSYTLGATACFKNNLSPNQEGASQFRDRKTPRLSQNSSAPRIQFNQRSQKSINQKSSSSKSKVKYYVFTSKDSYDIGPKQSSPIDLKVEDLQSQTSVHDSSELASSYDEEVAHEMVNKAAATSVRTPTSSSSELVSSYDEEVAKQNCTEDGMTPSSKMATPTNGQATHQPRYEKVLNLPGQEMSRQLAQVSLNLKYSHEVKILEVDSEDSQRKVKCKPPLPRLKSSNTGFEPDKVHSPKNQSKSVSQMNLNNFTKAISWLQPPPGQDCQKLQAMAQNTPEVYEALAASDSLSSSRSDDIQINMNIRKESKTSHLQQVNLDDSDRSNDQEQLEDTSSEYSYTKELMPEVNRNDFEGTEDDLSPDEKYFLIMQEVTTKENDLMRNLKEMRNLDKQMKYYKRRGKKVNKKASKTLKFLIKQCSGILCEDEVQEDESSISQSLDSAAQKTDDSQFKRFQAQLAGLIRQQSNYVFQFNALKLMKNSRSRENSVSTPGLSHVPIAESSKPPREPPRMRRMSSRLSGFSEKSGLAFRRPSVLDGQKSAGLKQDFISKIATTSFKNYSMSQRGTALGVSPITSPIEAGEKDEILEVDKTQTTQELMAPNVRSDIASEVFEQSENKERSRFDTEREAMSPLATGTQHSPETMELATPVLDDLAGTNQSSFASYNMLLNQNQAQQSRPYQVKMPLGNSSTFGHFELQRSAHSTQEMLLEDASSLQEESSEAEPARHEMTPICEEEEKHMNNSVGSNVFNNDKAFIKMAQTSIAQPSAKSYFRPVSVQATTKEKQKDFSGDITFNEQSRNCFKNFANRNRLNVTLQLNRKQNSTTQQSPGDDSAAFRSSEKNFTNSSSSPHANQARMQLEIGQTHSELDSPPNTNNKETASLCYSITGKGCGFLDKKSISVRKGSIGENKTVTDQTHNQYQSFDSSIQQKKQAARQTDIREETQMVTGKSSLASLTKYIDFDLTHKETETAYQMTYNAPPRERFSIRIQQSENTANSCEANKQIQTEFKSGVKLVKEHSTPAAALSSGKLGLSNFNTRVLERSPLNISKITTSHFNTRTEIVNNNRFGHSRVLSVSSPKNQEIIHKPKRGKLLKKFRSQMESLYKSINEVGPRGVLSPRLESEFKSTVSNHRRVNSPNSFYNPVSPKSIGSENLEARNINTQCSLRKPKFKFSDQDLKQRLHTEAEEVFQKVSQDNLHQLQVRFDDSPVSIKDAGMNTTHGSKRSRNRLISGFHPMTQPLKLKQNQNNSFNGLGGFNYNNY